MLLGLIDDGEDHVEPVIGLFAQPGGGKRGACTPARLWVCSGPTTPWIDFSRVKSIFAVEEGPRLGQCDCRHDDEAIGSGCEDM